MRRRIPVLVCYSTARECHPMHPNYATTAWTYVRNESDALVGTFPRKSGMAQRCNTNKFRFPGCSGKIVSDCYHDYSVCASLWSVTPPSVAYRRNIKEQAALSIATSSVYH